jgi:Flp pilus assembly protein TadG
MTPRRFLRAEDGYALVLSLVFLPAFLGITLLMIDVGRGNNAQTGTQAAVDALALAGARELDREPGARDRARLAMAEVTNTVGLLETVPGGGAQTLQYTGASDPLIEVTFLSAIPPSDDDPINATWITNNTATSDANAEFVHVRVVLEDFDSLFRRIASGITNDVRIGATATATNRQGTTCDLPTLFMCSPTPSGVNPVTAFDQGWFHARLLRLREDSNRGNFDFLDPGPAYGLSTMNNQIYGDNFLADRNRLQCVTAPSQVQTTTGNRNSLNAHFNTRFGLYENQGGGTRNQGFPSDVFVRKGYNMNGCTGNIDPVFRDNLLLSTSIDPANFNANGSFRAPNSGGNSGGGNSGRGNSGNNNSGGGGGQTTQEMGYPANYSMASIDGSTSFIGGQTPPAGTTFVWPVDRYLAFNYTNANLNNIQRQTYSSVNATANPNVNTPSRHDVYLYESANYPGTLTRQGSTGCRPATAARANLPGPAHAT